MKHIGSVEWSAGRNHVHILCTCGNVTGSLPTSTPKCLTILKEWHAEHVESDTLDPDASKATNTPEGK